MVDIGLSVQVSVSTLQRVLSCRLPTSAVCVCPDDDEAFLRASGDVLVRVVESGSEFPIGLDISVSLAGDSAFFVWARGLARVLSIDLSCKAICDGTGLGDDQSPYWSVIWDRGEAYLGDDAGTAYADGDGGAVQVVRRLAECPSVDAASLDALINKRPQ